MLKGTIPFIDLRDKTPIDLLRAYPDKARDTMHGGRRVYGALSQAASAVAMPFADRVSRRWLAKTRNPYLHEIESFAEILRMPGVYTFNMSFEWGCTTGAYRSDETVTLLRVLDWPFPDLGKHVVVALQQGRVGTYYNVTWPGVSGVFNAMAPSRFAAAINQAPMRMHKLGIAGDWIKNRLRAFRETGIPPAHLLRQVFDSAASYDDAKLMLTKTPVTVPVIFTLAGVEFGQGCVIERLENSAEVFDLSAEMRVTTANHFNSRFSFTGPGWRPREIDSAGRYRQSCTLSGHDLEQTDFRWLQSPIINPNTRLCITADAATGRLTVQGYEGSNPVTEIFNVPGAGGARQQAG